MIQTVRPLMLETTKGTFINSNIVRTALCDNEDSVNPDYYVGYIDNRGNAVSEKITEKSYSLLTQPSGQNLDLMG